MRDTKIPTLEEFRSLIGHSLVGRAFKTKNDFGGIYKALAKVTNADEARALRRACIAWLSKPDSNRRASHAAVSDLLMRANQRFMAYQEVTYLGTQSDSGTAVPINGVPNLPFGREMTEHQGGPARDIKRVGSAMHSDHKEEMKTRHWGPKVSIKMNEYYNTYKAAGGTLSIGAWADHIYLPNLEDDRFGKYLFGGADVSMLPQGWDVTDGVKYCTPDERKSYLINIHNGLLKDATGELYDTTGRQTHFSKYGWAIFVLGFDNELYSNTHLPNMFHHSSFFAGNPVQCGGEICCIAGKLRYLTNKTGHYRSSYWEFYRLLSFLHYHEVNLKNVLACNDVAASEWFLASDIYNANGKNPTSAPLATKAPRHLAQPGEPEWPVPPMQP